MVTNGLVADSDRQGLPMGVEILITATGAKLGEDPWDAPLVDLRTVVPIDRVVLPRSLRGNRGPPRRRARGGTGGTGTGDGQAGEGGEGSISLVASNPAAVDDQALEVEVVAADQPARRPTSRRCWRRTPHEWWWRGPTDPTMVGDLGAVKMISQTPPT